MSLYELELYKRLKVGDIILLHPSAYVYNTPRAYGLHYGGPSDVSQPYRLPHTPYMVIELRQGVMALVTTSGIAWVPTTYTQKIL